MNTKRKIAALSAIVLCGIVAHHSARRYMIELLSCRRQDNSPTNAVAYSSKPRNADFYIALEKMLQRTAAYMKVVAGKDCVWLIGRQGVGKSTLVHALYRGSRMIEQVKLPDEKVHLAPSVPLFSDWGKPLFTIGIGEHAITSYPKALQLGRQVLVESAGFGDSGGENSEINHTAIDRLIHKAGRIRVCFLIAQGHITSEASCQEELTSLLHTLLHLLKVKKYAQISSHHLSKVQIVVTHLKGDKRKAELQAKLIDAFRALLPKEQYEAIDQMVENVVLVDAADRVSQFKDVKHTWLGYPYSEDQTTVAALKSQLLYPGEDRWFAHGDFTPISEVARGAREEMYQKMKQEARRTISAPPNGKKRIEILFTPFKKASVRIFS